MTPKIDAHRITHRNNIHTGTIRNLRDLEIPGDHAEDFFAVTLHLLKCRDGDGCMF